MSPFGDPAREGNKACYHDLDKFLADMRAGTMMEDYYLSLSVWNGLVEMVNTDSEFAREIMDRGVLLLMAVDDGFEIDGLMALAEVCCENPARATATK